VRGPGRVQVGAPTRRELAEFEVVALRVQTAHDVAKAAPCVHVASERGHLRRISAELEEAEGGGEEGTARGHSITATERCTTSRLTMTSSYRLSLGSGDREAFAETSNSFSQKIRE
jgi:hypothetical protein